MIIFPIHVKKRYCIKKEWICYDDDGKHEYANKKE